jgi:hypothetical protein
LTGEPERRPQSAQASVRAHQTNTVDLLTFTYLPAALLGTWSGIAIFRRLTDLHFAICVNAPLIASGLELIL